MIVRRFVRDGKIYELVYNPPSSSIPPPNPAAKKQAQEAVNKRVVELGKTLVVPTQARSADDIKKALAPALSSFLAPALVATAAATHASFFATLPPSAAVAPPPPHHPPTSALPLPPTSTPPASSSRVPPPSLPGTLPPDTGAGLFTPAERAALTPPTGRPLVATTAPPPVPHPMAPLSPVSSRSTPPPPPLAPEHRGAAAAASRIPPDTGAGLFTPAERAALTPPTGRPLVATTAPPLVPHPMAPFSPASSRSTPPPPPLAPEHGGAVAAEPSARLSRSSFDTLMESWTSDLETATSNPRQKATLFKKLSENFILYLKTTPRAFIEMAPSDWGKVLENLAMVHPDQPETAEAMWLLLMPLLKKESAISDTLHYFLSQESSALNLLSTHYELLLEKRKQEQQRVLREESASHEEGEHSTFDLDQAMILSNPLPPDKAARSSFNFYQRLYAHLVGSARPSALVYEAHPDDSFDLSSKISNSPWMQASQEEYYHWVPPLPLPTSIPSILDPAIENFDHQIQTFFENPTLTSLDTLQTPIRAWIAYLNTIAPPLDNQPRILRLLKTALTSLTRAPSAPEENDEFFITLYYALTRAKLLCDWATVNQTLTHLKDDLIPASFSSINTELREALSILLSDTRYNDETNRMSVMKAHSRIVALANLRQILSRLDTSTTLPNDIRGDIRLHVLTAQDSLLDTNASEDDLRTALADVKYALETIQLPFQYIAVAEKWQREGSPAIIIDGEIRTLSKDLSLETYKKVLMDLTAGLKPKNQFLFFHTLLADVRGDIHSKLTESPSPSSIIPGASPTRQTTLLRSGFGAPFYLADETFTLDKTLADGRKAFNQLCTYRTFITFGSDEEQALHAYRTYVIHDAEPFGKEAVYSALASPSLSPKTELSLI